jgi:D-sedoheptulose 7-phosphate isomerase
MNNARGFIENLVAESLRVKSEFFRQNASLVAQTAESMAKAMKNGGKLLLFGNGGSAADAQHIATEFVGRFIPDRLPLPALSLVTDTSALTAISNDYGFNTVFARQVQALGKAGDIALGISTSGNSPNVLEAMETARRKGMLTIGFTGQDGGKMKGHADVLFCVPSRVVPRIQETHITLGHVLCELIDRELFPEAYPRN